MPNTVAKTSIPESLVPLRAQSRRLVSNVFFGTILKQVHDSPWRSGLFSGGQAGRTFESLLDERLADRMASSPVSQGLVNSIVRKLARKQGLKIEKPSSAAESRTPEATFDVRG